MSMSTLHVLHAIYLPGGNAVTQLSDGVATNQFNELIGMSAGHHIPLFTGILENKPEITFRSSQLRTLLNALGFSGLDTSSGGNADLEWRKAQDLGTRFAFAGANNIRTRLTQGLLYWRTITAEQGQVAEMDCRLCVTWDGTNLPMVPTGSVALNATPSAAEQFTVGPVKINGSFVNGVKGITIESGAQLYEELSDGDTYTTFAGIMEHNPVVATIRTREATNWTAYGISPGTALSAFIGYFKRVTPDGVVYAAGSAQHIKLTNDYGIVLGPSGRGGNNNPIDTELRVLLRANSATTNPLTITLDSTIT